MTVLLYTWLGIALLIVLVVMSAAIGETLRRKEPQPLLSVGTRSVLFGYHQFLIHPFFVGLAWCKLYGFPWDPRLWVAFFVHDLGYIGKPNMDGPEGELHPYFGAFVMEILFDTPLLEHFRRASTPYRPKSLRWWKFTLLHSRFLAKARGEIPSRLCIADKYSIVIQPVWSQLLMMRLSGELKEYMSGRPGRTPAEGMTPKEWVLKMKGVLKEFVSQHQNAIYDSEPHDLTV